MSDSRRLFQAPTSGGSVGQGSSLPATDDGSSTANEAAVSSVDGEALSHFAISELESNVDDSEVLLVSSNEVTFKISRELAGQIGVVKEALELVEDSDDRQPCPLIDVHADTLRLVIEYLQQNETPADPFETPEAEMEYAQNKLECNKMFVADLSQTEFHNLMKAADKMDIPDLLKLCCNHLTNKIHNKNPSEIRNIFGFPPARASRQRNIISKKAHEDFVQANAHNSVIVFNRINDNDGDKF